MRGTGQGAGIDDADEGMHAIQVDVHGQAVHFEDIVNIN
jgi:hypothetical protein